MELLQFKILFCSWFLIMILFWFLETGYDYHTWKCYIKQKWGKLWSNQQWNTSYWCMNLPRDYIHYKYRYTSLSESRNPQFDEFIILCQHAWSQWVNIHIGNDQTKKPNNCRMKTGLFNTLPHWHTFIESKACPLMVKWT